jgi:hypothetical protein
MPAFGLLGIDFGHGFDALPGQAKANGWETHFGQQFKKLILNFLKHTVMRKQFLYLFLLLVFMQAIGAQTRGTKLGFIDMEYILQNVPDYTEAKGAIRAKN